MEIINNPIDVVLEAFVNLYGENPNITIYFDFDMPTKGKDKCFGETLFVDNSDKIFIRLNGNVSFDKTAVILAHELAHTVVPTEAEEHGKEWNEANDKIFVEFARWGQERGMRAE